MNNPEIDILIHRRLSGEASEAEQKALEAWLAEEENHRVYYRQLEELWREAGEVDYSLDPRTASEWDKVRRRIAGECTSAPAEARLRRLPVWWRYAAAALAVLGLFALWRLFLSVPAGLPLAQIYETDPGEQRSVTLPDGSTVVLNAASFLGVAEGFGETERRLELRGEGFFDVASDPERPFLIQTGKVTTQVTGTAFNLRAYADAPEIKLTVTEGKVAFSELRSGQKQEVSAGMAAVFDRGEGEIRTAAFDDRAAAWREGWLVFENTPLAEVWRTLERRYGVRITDRSGQGDRRYTTSFRNEDLDTVLEVLRQTFGLEVRRKDGRITVE